jgi:hypothetical protein
MTAFYAPRPGLMLILADDGWINAHTGDILTGERVDALGLDSTLRTTPDGVIPAAPADVAALIATVINPTSPHAKEA